MQDPAGGLARNARSGLPFWTPEEAPPMAARSLAARATLAVVLMIGFYLLALAVAAVLVFLPYAEMRWGHRIHFQLAFFCIAGAGIVLWSAIPKRDKFTAPGPLLERSAQPRLFELIDKVA